jgi:uncharacterized protein (UPF0335 family)
MEFKWVNENNNVISCIEKIKILNENMAELTQTIKDVHDDAILMGVSNKNFKKNIALLFEQMFG